MCKVEKTFCCRIPLCIVLYLCQLYYKLPPPPFVCLNNPLYSSFTTHLSSNINHLRSSLQRQQDKKRCHAQANHKKYLYRRFHKITTKPSGDNTPNPPTHTVINLTDTALSDPQVKLLSRGLKFCPKPKEHNQLLC